MNFKNNKRNKMINKFLFTFLFCSITVTLTAQNCRGISVSRDKNNGTETRSGITNSSDFYSLLIFKETNRADMSLEPKYSFLLNAASRVVLSDSIVNTKGVIELLLKNNSKLILENAKCFNNPMPFGFCIAFSVTVTKEQLEIISKNPIVTFSAFGIFSTSFKERRQKEQQRIINCLLQWELIRIWQTYGELKKCLQPTSVPVSQPHILN